MRVTEEKIEGSKETQKEKVEKQKERQRESENEGVALLQIVVNGSGTTCGRVSYQLVTVG